MLFDYLQNLAYFIYIFITERVLRNKIKALGKELELMMLYEQDHLY